MGKAGARRIRMLESPWSTADPVEEYLLRANWEPRDILGARAQRGVRKHQLPGTGKKYSRLTVPFGGYVYPAFDLNHSYEDCDVFVSLAKMKEHATAGITLSMKNCFGLTPVHHLRQRGGHRRAFGDAQGRPHHGPRGKPAAVEKRSAGEGPAIAARRTRGACRAPWWTWWPPARFTWRLSKASRP